MIATRGVADEPAAPPAFVLEWGKAGDADGEFKSPVAIAVDAHDSLYVTEFNGNRVQKFDDQGKFLAKFAIEQPSGIAVGHDGRVYVARMLAHLIVAHDKDGMKLFEFGEKGDGGGQFNQPGGMAFGPDGNLYVCDQANHRVQVFTPEGKFVRNFGGWGAEPGQFGGAGTQGARFAGPHFLAFDKHGDLWTTEGARGRVQKLTVEGKPLFAFGKNDDAPGGFGGREEAARNALPGPIGIAFDGNDRLWVSATNSRVQLFTTEGRYLTGMGEGSEPGRFVLPHAVVLDSKGFVYVVDSSNQRVQKFQP